MALQSVTVRTVKALKSGETIWDANHREAVRGFGVRRQRGNPVYVIKYRVYGRQRFVTIGPHGSPWTPDKARREAKRLLGLVAEGKDPQAEKIDARAKAADTIGKVANDYLKHAKKKLKPRSYVETERHLLVNCKPLHPVSIFQLHRRQIAARLSEIAAQRSNTTAARTVPLCRPCSIGQFVRVSTSPAILSLGLIAPPNPNPESEFLQAPS